MPQGRKPRTARTGQIGKKVQASPEVKTGDQLGTSKSEGKRGDQPKQVEGGAKAPPKENPSPPDPQPSTSKDPTNAPAEVPTQDPTEETPQEPEEETPLFSLIM